MELLKEKKESFLLIIKFDMFFQNIAQRAVQRIK